MIRQNNDSVLQAAMEMLNENGFEAYAQVLRILLNEAMKIEREQTLNAAPYQWTEARRGYANGYKPKTIDTRMGKITVSILQVLRDSNRYPQNSLC